MSSSDCPRFYKSDMIPLIQERNELKERVLELEEEVKTLRQQIGCQCNKQGSIPSSRGCKQHKSSQEAPIPVSVLDKPIRPCVYAESHVTDVLVSGYLKKARKHLYIVKVTWSDGQRYEVFRSYGEFFTLRNTLLQQFPEQELKSARNTIPPLSSHTWDLFGRINTASLTKARLGTINTFCQMLILQLMTAISRSAVVIKFFRPTIGDKQLPRLKKNSDIDLSILSVYPQNIPAGSLFEPHIVLADYTGESENELSVKAGDIVQVVQKLDSGWWLVSKSGCVKEQLGYISGDFLKPYEDKDTQWRSSDERSNGLLDSAKVDPEMKYVAVEDYVTSDPRQLGFNHGDLMIVLEKSDDGWWLAVLNVRQGWVPGSFLVPHQNNPDQERDLPHCEKGEEYVALSGYQGIQKEDISFLKGAIVEVLEKDENGWWVVRYLNKMGMAPANFLAPKVTMFPAGHELSMTGSDDYLKMEIRRSLSGIATPPPRSKRFLRSTQRRMRGKASSKSPAHSPAYPPIPLKSLH